MKITFLATNPDYNPSNDVLNVTLSRTQCDHEETFRAELDFSANGAHISDITSGEWGSTTYSYAATVLAAFACAFEVLVDNHPDAGFCAPNEYFAPEGLEFELPC